MSTWLRCRTMSSGCPRMYEGSSTRWCTTSARRRCSRSGPSEAREPQADLAGRGLLGIGPVDEVLAVGQRQVAADRPGSGLASVGRAVEFAHDRDGLIALEDDGDQRAGRHEIAQRRVPRLLDMIGIVL